MPELQYEQKPQNSSEARVASEERSKMQKMAPKAPKITPQWHANLVKELRRKLIHITGLSVPIGIIVFGRIYTAAMIAVALSVAVILEAGRLSGRIKLPEVRESEKSKVAGYIYYIIGSLITVVLFQPMIALTSMLMLSLGDAVSGIAGSVLENSDVRSRGQRMHQAFSDCDKHVSSMPNNRLHFFKDNRAALRGISRRCNRRDDSRLCRPLHS